MLKHYFFLLLLAGLLLSSCVPTQDMIYLQRKDENANETLVNTVNSKPYRVQSNDILSISIKTIDPKLAQIFNPTSNENSLLKSDQLLYFEGYTVNDHGVIRVPVLGEVLVLGLTTEEIRKKIEERLLSEYFYKESNLFVNVRMAGFRYTINGEVQLPGTKTLYQEKVTILEAIANSGDITMTGNRKEVMVIRQLPQGVEMHTIDLTDSKALQSNYYNLQPNDYIYVKPLSQKSWGTGKTGLESLSFVLTVLSLLTTTFLLLRK